MAKSIFEVDVNDESFVKFKKMFDAYNAALKKMPGQWDKVNETLDDATDRMEKLDAGVGKVEGRLVEAGAATRVWHHSLREADRAFGSIDTRLRSIGATVRGIWSSTANFARATGITALGSGLLGAGALWGMSNMARSAGDTRRTTQGFGMQPGEVDAFRTNYSKMVDPGSVLGNIANARNDPGSWWAFTSMGMQNWQNRSTADLATSMPLQAKRVFEEGGGNAQYAQARGLTQFFSLDDLRRLSAMTNEEIEASGRRYQADVRQMKVSDDLARRWQSLATQLDRAATAVETSFLRALGPLAPELEKLSDAFTNAVTNILTLDRLKEIIVAAGQGIERAAKYLGSEEFVSDMKKFGRSIEEVWAAIQRVVRWINSFSLSGPPAPDTRPPVNPRFQAEDFSSPEERAARWDRMSAEWRMAPHRLPPDRAGHTQGSPGYDPISASEIKHDLPEGLLDKVWAVESGRGVRMRGTSGEMGHFQFMPATGAAYQLRRPEHFDDLELSSRAAGHFLFDLRQHFRGNLRAAVAAYNYRGTNPNGVQKLMSDHGDRWEEFLPPSTREYLQNVLGASRHGPAVRIVVENNTGGSATVTQNVTPYQ